MTKRMRKKQKKRIYSDTLCGIDREKDSPSFRRVVVGGTRQLPILLWREPGCTDADDLTGALKHGDGVNVFKEKDFDGVVFAYCKTAVHHKGRKYYQVGWVSTKLLLNRGRELYYNDVDLASPIEERPSS